VIRVILSERKGAPKAQREDHDVPWDREVLVRGGNMIRRRGGEERS